MDSWQSVKPTSTLSVCLKLCKKENPRCWGPSNSLVTDAWTNWKARYKTPDFLSFLHTIPNISASFLIILFIHKIVLNCDDYFAYDVEIYEMCLYEIFPRWRSTRVCWRTVVWWATPRRCWKRLISPASYKLQSSCMSGTQRGDYWPNNLSHSWVHQQCIDLLLITFR